ncbi:hypothetical protein [Streptomyces sp. NPDC051286]|uniref:hypothetical protein n=1 Tax=Streptomyces sp. NPDC051286 TaxID=3365647 RepID=UPI003789D932
MYTKTVWAKILTDGHVPEAAADLAREAEQVGRPPVLAAPASAERALVRYEVP